MKYRFKKHYTRDEAQSLLPQLRLWLAELNRLREETEKFQKRLNGMNVEGQDIGGETVNSWIKSLAGIQAVLLEFQNREIQIKDLSRGLVDFPAIIGGREVFLCWEADEDTVEFWHDLETGYGGREKLG
jgi:hypothetical protein